MFGQKFLDKGYYYLLLKYKKKKTKLIKQSHIIFDIASCIIRQIKQEICLQKQVPCPRPSVLLCADTLLKNGGIEKRLLQYSCTWEAKGFRVLLAAREGNGTADIWFTGNRFYNDWLFSRFACKNRIQVVEWNAGGANIPWLTFKKLQKQNIKFGVIVHASNNQWHFDYLQQANYVFCSHFAHGERVRSLRKYPVLPNAVLPQKPCWKFFHQHKAIIISRLAEDKRPSLEGFISLCTHWKIPFYIAGDFSDKEGSAIKRSLQKTLLLNESVFLGKVDTVPFLYARWKDFLFVGGVGQVILEAGQLDYPCLLCSLLGAQESFFVCKSNLSQVLNYNCSPHTPAENKLLKQNQNIEKCIKQICMGETTPYQLGNKINTTCNLDNNLRQYARHTPQITI